MNRDRVLSAMQASAAAGQQCSLAQRELSQLPSPEERTNYDHLIFRAAWYALNVLLFFSILLASYSILWEYSTRRYLKGFSDAVVPESSSAEGKVEAIVNWMANGPARQQVGPFVASPDRDPTDTLNYSSLLRVCGSATNAFINLANSAGVPARRLLLLDARRLTKHVVAEALVNGRWIIVDSAFRLIPRGRNGELLTRQDLADPAVLAAATRNIPNYSPDYTYNSTSHVRLGRIPFVGGVCRSILNRLLPGWEDSTTITLLLERRSFAATVLAIILVLLLILLRAGLRWCGESRMGIRPVRIRRQVRRALHAFVDTSR